MSVSRLNRRNALSLVEVVASLALLGTLLVSMLLAHSRIIKQTTRADQIRTATNLADQLLAEWFVNDEIPESGRGVFERHPKFQWSTQVVERINELPVPANIVLLTVSYSGATGRSPLFETELVVAMETGP